MDEYLLSRHVFPAQVLMAAHPPRWQNESKRLVARLSCPDGATHSGEVTFTRWRAIPLPESLPEPVPKIESRPDYFTYESSGPGEWHLNFADRNLFGYYAGPLFAQDEMQVAEHPALGALKEALLSQRVPCDTVDGESPTPVLVQGVERRCAIDSRGIYGNAFARAEVGAIQSATHVLSPPTVSNILAVEAPAGGFGEYSRAELKYVLVTAFTGFSAAKLVSKDHPITIHTGFWGCGAYGGNRTLMVALQILAAWLAGVEKIVFHTGDAASLSTIDAARALAEGSGTLAERIDALLAQDFRWGVSDGN